METIQKIVNDNPDSLTVGTPGKQGEVKVYGNFNDMEAFKAKIDNAAALRSYANEKLNGSAPK